MLTIEELYKKVIASSESKKVDEDLIKLEYDPFHLECILKPDKIKLKWQTCNDECRDEGKIFIECLFKHLSKNEKGDYVIEIKDDKCRHCIDEEKLKKMIQMKDIMLALEAIHEGKQPVYATVAPAFLSQFDIIEDGQLRSAFKHLGFTGMIEVSLFADILTLKEALEFDKDINDESDFQLTSCCCPIWISMIRKVYPKLLSHVPKAVSPMVASGRVIKKLIPNAFTVFIGPCLAKKTEAKEEDIKDAIDVVLTFQEIKDIFEVAKIDPAELPFDLREHSSHSGRIYAITSGVSESVHNTVKRLRPERPIQVNAVQANGTIECKKLLKQLETGEINANFLEGMGCVGGCVGGPRSLIDKDLATDKVRKYAEQSLYPTPIDNPYVVELLHRLDIRTIEQLIDEQTIFTRHF